MKAVLCKSYCKPGELVVEEQPSLSAGPGQVVAVSREGVEVACGEGRLLLLEVQPAGSRAMPAAALVNGRQLAVGGRLGIIGLDFLANGRILLFP